VQIIAVDLALDRKAGRVKAGALGTPPIPVNPSAVDTDPESRSQQAKERPAEPFIDDIAAFARMLGAGKERQSRLVGDGGIIECERARKKSVACNTMSVGKTRRSAHRHHQR
jgi:hypothetical protein